MTHLCKKSYVVSTRRLNAALWYVQHVQDSRAYTETEKAKASAYGYILRGVSKSADSCGDGFKVSRAVYGLVDWCCERKAEWDSARLDTRRWQN